MAEQLYRIFVFVSVLHPHAVPHTAALCRQRPIKGGCQLVNETWQYEPRTKMCFPQRNVICGGRQGGFQTKEFCMNCQQNNVKKGQLACPPTPVFGGCQPRHHHWYFDPEYRQCQRFQRGECSGGENHFVTEYKCRETCLPGMVKPPPRCQQRLVRGHCRELQHFWTFDYRKNDCVQYPKGLCGSGPNIFVSKEKCMIACNKPLGRKMPDCLKKPRIGSCHQKKFAWFFDGLVGRCRMFSYGDCGAPGANHFETEVMCKKECMRIGDPYPVCSAKPISAYCLGFGTYWYFDITANNCYRFKGGWCGKNANGFVSYEACMSYCSYPEAPSYPPQSINNIPGQLQQQVKGTG
ncbi:papilin-like isoform X2 [Rhipicephalus microplus]|uniref:papilin-like isoform X2 n=1 Tax=Rhipicephalus microplus TaxID=6941 RepID=UPI003F6BAA06